MTRCVPAQLPAATICPATAAGGAVVDGEGAGRAVVLSPALSMVFGAAVGVHMASAASPSSSMCCAWTEMSKG